MRFVIETVLFLLVAELGKLHGLTYTSSNVIKIETGLVRGVEKVSALGKKLMVFYGVPFAEPPLGRLRYKPPIAAESWTNVLDATRYKAPCLQKKFPFKLPTEYLKKFDINSAVKPSEDCLHLNVFVPENLPEKASVFVWIYGGGFSRGGSDVVLYDASTMSTEGNIIVVTFNYRVASFGFLFTDHPDAPGNVGLMDQVLALQWVRRNIGFFGGDPSSVTLAGQSAGASSVGYHLLLKQSRHLFQRAIMQSGAPHASFAFERKSVLLRRASELASNVGCPTNVAHPESLLQCLREKDPYDLLENEPQTGYDNIYMFKPVADGKFIVDHPLKLLNNATAISKVDILIGSVKDESSVFLALMYPLVFQFGDQFQTTMHDLTDVATEVFGLTTATIGVMKALYENPSKKDDPNIARDMTIRMCSESSFECPLADVEKVYATHGGDVYKYYFTYRPEDLPVPRWFGAHHASDLIYTFGHALNPAENRPEFEKQFSQRVMGYWINFAKTGNPNDETTKIFWPRFTPENEEYLVLHPNTSVVGHHFKNKICTFWRNIIPQLLEIQKPTEDPIADISRSNT